MQHHLITKEIQTITDTLGACSSFEPSPVINEVLTRLVDIILTTPKQTATLVLTDLYQGGFVEKLQHYTMSAETALEFDVTKHYLRQSSLSWNDIQSFQYFSCYQALTAIEMSVIGTSSTPVLFVGGGPLPLSALIMAHDYKQPVTVIDHDTEAVILAQKLVATLGLTHLVQIIHCNVYEYQPVESNIILAAMVGTTAHEKTKIASHLFTKSPIGTTVLARGVTGLATLLYVPQTSTHKWYTLHTISDPGVINCVHVWKK